MADAEDVRTTYRALSPHGMAISGGTCPTVGITGLTTGGGLGVLSRQHGLTCDNLVEVDVVTAHGGLLRANDRDHADLLWATRGGGGGSFGIITALTFELVPVDMTFTELAYEFPWSAAKSVLAAWQDPALTPSDFSAPHAIGKVLLEAADGAVNAIAPDATAFVHRDNLFVTQFQSRWRDHGSRAVVDANIEWTDGLYDAVGEYRSGFGYQNYIDPRLEGWEHAYYGANWSKLRAVKSRYYPGDLFSFAQSVPPA